MQIAPAEDFSTEDTAHLTGITINISPPSPLPSRRNTEAEIFGDSSGDDEVFHDADETIATTTDESFHSEEGSDTTVKLSSSVDTEKVASNIEEYSDASGLGKSESTEKSDECVCLQLNKSDSDHSYDNSSLEGDEYDKLLNHVGCGKRKSGPKQNTVVEVTVHSDDLSQNLSPTEITAGERTDLTCEKGNISENISDSEKSEQNTAKILSQSARDARSSILKNSKRKKKTNQSVKLDPDQNGIKVKWKEEKEDISDMKSDGAGDSEENLKPKKDFFKLSFKGKKQDKKEKKQDVECIGFSSLNKDLTSEDKKGIFQASSPPFFKRSLSEHDDSSSVTEDGSVKKRTKSEKWVNSKFRRSLSSPERERNNNDSDFTDGASITPEGLAQRRWKMVLNVQKFQSVVKQQQEQMKLPPVEKIREEKKPLAPKISMRIVSYGLY